MMMINDIYSKWEALLTKFNGNLIISGFFISKKCPSHLYFGYDGEKKYIFVEFEQGSLATFKIPKVKGLDISVVAIPEISKNNDFVQIYNVDNKDEVFLAFCSTLTNELKSCLSFLDVSETIKETIKYYKTYFSNPKTPLSEEEEQGLFCELIFLERLIKKNGQEAVKNWEGPNKNKRDFVFDDKSIEIKSTSSQISPSIKISNELQLDCSYPTNINLFLKVMIVEKVEEGDKLTLVAKRIIELLTDVEIASEFKRKLLLDKVDLELYEDINNYSIQLEHFYKVDDKFPSITTSSIPNSVFKVEYRLSLSNLTKWEIPE